MKPNDIRQCEIEHCVSSAKTSKHYAIRAKREGSRGVFEIYSAERKEWMNAARRIRRAVK